MDHLERRGDPIEVVRGRHEDHGDVIMIRDATRCMALVDEPAFLDQMLAEASPDAMVLARAMRAGWR